MTPTNPQDIAAALAFLAEQGVDTGWKYIDYEDHVLPGWYRRTFGKLETQFGQRKGSVRQDFSWATPYDIHAITDMLAVQLDERSLFVTRVNGDEPGTVEWIAKEHNGKCYRVLDCDDNRLAAHLAACREVEG